MVPLIKKSIKLSFEGWRRDNFMKEVCAISWEAVCNNKGQSYRPHHDSWDFFLKPQALARLVYDWDQIQYSHEALNKEYEQLG